MLDTIYESLRKHRCIRGLIHAVDRYIVHEE